MQPCLINHNRQEEAGRFILESVSSQPDSYCTTDLSSKKISRLVSRKDPVPDDIKQAACKSKIIGNVYKYFDDEIMNDINPVLESDLVDKFNRVIDVDMQIGKSKKDELKKLYDAGEYSKFLAETFIYCLFRDNKNSSEEIEYQDIPFLDEVNYECPLTQEKLVENVKGISVRRYVITQIFPEDLTDAERIAFESSHKRPSSYDSSDNLIALSERASDNYLMNPTLDEFNNLYEIKQILSKRHAAKLAIDRMQLEEEIRDVVSALMDIPSTGMIQLEYEALKIKQKIKDDPLLKNEIQRQVVEYYRFIENVFKELESEFDLIATEIKLSSMKLENVGMSKEEIISSLSDWIHSKTNLGSKGKIACSIVVAFFIQNCEVFSNEVSK